MRFVQEEDETATWGPHHLIQMSRCSSITGFGPPARVSRNGRNASGRLSRGESLERDQSMSSPIRRLKKRASITTSPSSVLHSRDAAAQFAM